MPEPRPPRPLPLRSGKGSKRPCPPLEPDEFAAIIMELGGKRDQRLYVGPTRDLSLFGLIAGVGCPLRQALTTSDYETQYSEARLPSLLWDLLEVWERLRGRLGLDTNPALFTTQRGRSEPEILSDSYVRMSLRRVARKAGITRKISVTSLRRSRQAVDALGPRMTWNHYRKVFRGSLGKIPMPSCLGLVT